MRKKAKVQAKLEKLSVGDTLHAIRFADVCVLVMDAGEAFEKQDLSIGDLVIARRPRARVRAWRSGTRSPIRARTSKK